jgi:hypothetical protein
MYSTVVYYKKQNARRGSINIERTVIRTAQEWAQSSSYHMFNVAEIMLALQSQGITSITEQQVRAVVTRNFHRMEQNSQWFTTDCPTWVQDRLREEALQHLLRLKPQMREIWLREAAPEWRAYVEGYIQELSA